MDFLSIKLQFSFGLRDKKKKADAIFSLIKQVWLNISFIKICTLD